MLVLEIVVNVHKTLKVTLQIKKDLFDWLQCILTRIKLIGWCYLSCKFIKRQKETIKVDLDKSL